MTDNWNFYALRVEDKRASIYLDLGIASDAPINQFHHMGYVRLRMRNPREDGMSSQEEYDDLIKIEDQLTTEVEKNNSAIYIGRCTTNNCRDFYFYSNDRLDFAQTVKQTMDLFPAYQYQTDTREDPKWSSYFDFLYPSPLSQQIMANKDVRFALEDEGDDLNLSRLIDHRVYFKSKKQTKKYIEFVLENGFSIIAVHRESLFNGRHIVDFHRNDIPKDIDDVVIPIWEKAIELDGVYDGWGCEVQIS